MVEYGYKKYRTSHDHLVNVPVFYCVEDDLFSINVNEELLEKHNSVASYVLLRNEERWYRMREQYLNGILNQVVQYKKDPSILDIGCAYGHLLKKAKDNGIMAEGVEVNSILRERLQASGFKIYRELNEVTTKYDAMIFIDSFYYFNFPVEALAKCREHLNDDGIILMRLANRNWLAKVKGRNRGLEALGDATYAYSMKSIKKLMEKSGFRVEKVHIYEKGKKLSLRKAAIYLGTYVLTLLLMKRVIITPGITLVIKKVK